MKPKISICIPVFNQEIESLVQSLLRQVATLNETIEILVFDDGSDEFFKEKNRNFLDGKNLTYTELEENIGRSAIRNLLAENATADALLFLDDDSEIIASDFLKNYLENLGGENVICGGTVYPAALPDSKFSLHWKMGKKREGKDLSYRQANPHRSFHSNNFLISKEIWQVNPFDETLKIYGHEDTLMSFQLWKKEVSILHIENPVLHNGLEENERFLKKSRLALENLKLLYEREDADFTEFVKLLGAFEKAKSLKAAAFLSERFTKKRGKWERKLSKENPSLKLFDLYKLSFFCSLFS